MVWPVCLEGLTKPAATMAHYIDPDAAVRNHTDPLTGDAVVGGSVEGHGLSIIWQDEGLLDPNVSPPGPGDGTNITNRHGATIRDVLLTCKLRLQFLGTAPSNGGAAVSQLLLDTLQDVINACPENR